MLQDCCWWLAGANGRKLQELFAFSPSAVPSVDPENVVIVPPPNAVQESPAFDPAVIEIVPVALPPIAPTGVPVVAPAPAVVPPSPAPAVAVVPAPVPAPAPMPAPTPDPAEPPASTNVPVPGLAPVANPFASPPSTLPVPPEALPQETMRDIEAPAPSSLAKAVASAGLLSAAVSAIILCV